MYALYLKYYDINMYMFSPDLQVKDLTSTNDPKLETTTGMYTYM